MADAGRFGEWITAMQAGLRSGAGIDVPCGGCVACCTSGQTILVSAAEAAALPAGAVVAVGGDGELALARSADGRCALLVDGRCTVYDVRPTRCRTYDCRIFPATGLVPEADKPAIAAAAARWTFRYESDDDRRRQEATRMAAFALRHSQLGGRPTSATQLAVTAVQSHEEFVVGLAGSEPTDP